MSASNQIVAYEDVREAADRALSASVGIRVRCATSGAAIHFRQRFYKFRALDRSRSKEFYSKGDPAYGTSVYDKLVATVQEVDKTHVVEIRKHEAGSLEIEELE